MQDFPDTEMAARPGRRPPTRIDWKRAAGLIAEGERPAAVAATLGIPEERLWRHLDGSPHFRLLIRQANTRWRRLMDLLAEEAPPDGSEPA